MTTRSTQLHCLALAGVLTLGATIALLVAGEMVGNAIVYQWYPYQPAEEIFILPDGTPVVCAHEVDDEGVICHGLDGRRVKARRAYSGGHYPETASLAYLAAPLDPQAPFRDLTWSKRLVQIQGPPNGPMSWYFLHDGKREGRGYFVGYDRKSKLSIGYIGRHGATVGEPPLEQQFAVDGRRLGDQSRSFFACNYYEPADIDPRDVAAMRQRDDYRPFTTMFLADDGLMQVNLKEQTVTCLRKDDRLISAAIALLKEVETVRSGKPSESFQQTILLRLPDRVVALNTSGREIQTYLLPAELRQRKLQWLHLPGKQVLVRPGGLWWDDELFWIDAKGTVVRHEFVKLEKHGEFNRVRKDLPLSLIAPSPATIAVLAACGPWTSLDDPESTRYWHALARALTQGSVPWVMALLSIVSASLCYRRQRTYALPWTAAWVAFIALTGLPGYIGYLSHRRWPARLPCPHCGRRVPRDCPACFACHQTFPPPPAKGIEVFA